MKREDLLHVVRASADITGEDRFVIIGSQSILAYEGELPDEMTLSVEADIYPKYSPEKSILIDGAIGEGSPFESSFGYYAHGIAPGTATCPDGWEARTAKLEVETLGGNSVVAECLEIHDLLLSKCVASRERDWEFVGAAIREGLCDTQTLLDRSEDLPVSDSVKNQVRRMIKGLVARASKRDGDA